MQIYRNEADEVAIPREQVERGDTVWVDMEDGKGKKQCVLTGRGNFQRTAHQAVTDAVMSEVLGNPKNFAGQRPA